MSLFEYFIKCNNISLADKTNGVIWLDIRQNSTYYWGPHNTDLTEFNFFLINIALLCTSNTCYLCCTHIFNCLLNTSPVTNKPFHYLHTQAQYLQSHTLWLFELTLIENLLQKKMHYFFRKLKYLQSMNRKAVIFNEVTENDFFNSFFSLQSIQIT